MAPDLLKTQAVREVGNCSKSVYPDVRSVVNIVPLSQRTLPFQLKLRPAAMLAESLTHTNLHYALVSPASSLSWRAS